MPELIPIEIIENKIFVIRGHKVMLDSDLARLYSIETKIFNRAVRRNIERFPKNFMFQLTDEEWKNLRCQIGTSKTGLGGRRYNPYVFTEYGVVMLSSVLNSPRAVAVNIQVINTFVKLKEMIRTSKDLSQKLNEMEHQFIKYAQEMNINIEDIYKQLDYLKNITKPQQIGFKTED